MVAAFFFSFKAVQKLKELIVCTTTVAGTQGMWLQTSKVGPVLDECFQWENNSATVCPTVVPGFKHLRKQ